MKRSFTPGALHVDISLEAEDVLGEFEVFVFDGVVEGSVAFFVLLVDLGGSELGSKCLEGEEGVFHGGSEQFAEVDFCLGLYHSTRVTFVVFEDFVLHNLLGLFDLLGGLPHQVVEGVINDAFAGFPLREGSFGLDVVVGEFAADLLSVVSPFEGLADDLQLLFLHEEGVCLFVGAASIKLKQVFPRGCEAILLLLHFLQVLFFVFIQLFTQACTMSSLHC